MRVEVIYLRTTAVCVSAWGPRRMRKSGDPLAIKRKGTIKLPEVDRIYTVTEGNGITGTLCGAKVCEKNVRKAEAYR